MKRLIIFSMMTTAVVAFIGAAVGLGATIPEAGFDVEVSDTSADNRFNWEINRGAARYFKIAYKQYGEIVDLSDASSSNVTLFIKASNVTNVYAFTGTIYSATGGTVRVLWPSTSAPPVSVYNAWFAVPDSPNVNNAAQGKIKVVAGYIDGVSTAMPFFNFVWRILAGDNVTISPPNGYGEVTINATQVSLSGCVTQIVGGTGIDVTPGTGQVRTVSIDSATQASIAGAQASADGAQVTNVTQDLNIINVSNLVTAAQESADGAQVTNITQGLNIANVSNLVTAAQASADGAQNTNVTQGLNIGNVSNLVEAAQASADGAQTTNITQDLNIANVSNLVVAAQASADGAQTTNVTQDLNIANVSNLVTAARPSFLVALGSAQNNISSTTFEHILITNVLRDTTEGGMDLANSRFVLGSAGPWWITANAGVSQVESTKTTSMFIRHVSNSGGTTNFVIGWSAAGQDADGIGTQTVTPTGSALITATHTNDYIEMVMKVTNAGDTADVGGTGGQRVTAYRGWYMGE